jgi:hypothetical protein
VGIVYPSSPDTLDAFPVPSEPEGTPLSEAGAGNTRDHAQHHQDLGAAVVSLEQNAAQLTHDHSGAGVPGVVITNTTVGQVPVNDIQTISLVGPVTAGTFELTFNSYTTGAIAYNAAAADVQAALVALASVGTGNVAVTGNPSGPWQVTFQGTLAFATQPDIIADNILLTGGTVGVVHTVLGVPAVSAVQTITLTNDPTDGTFTLTHESNTAVALAYNAAAADVENALAALSSIGAGNVVVTGAPMGPYTVSFQGAMGSMPVALITVVSNLTGSLFATPQLLQANTHGSADTDTVTGIHHSLGQGPYQAAPGNHAHDFQGPGIFNQPLLRCTSTTRPPDPYPGLQIWEVDTNASRVWAAFPGNTYVGQAAQLPSYTYKFDTNNSTTTLDPNMFALSYVVGSPGAKGGYICAPSAGLCTWHRGSDPNETTRVIARAVMANNAITPGDDQAVSFVTGKTHTMDMANVPSKKAGGGTSPTNDVYLRMSADGQNYVRFAVGNVGVAILYTNSGYKGEVPITGANYGASNKPNVTWTCKAMGDTYMIYANNSQIVSGFDTDGMVNKGPNNRGWGFGMTAAAFTGGSGDPIQQQKPNDITSITSAAGSLSYTTNYIWQLTQGGASPVFRAEAQTTQAIQPNQHQPVTFTTVPEDWFGWLGRSKIMRLDISNTDMVINEPGHYYIKGSICWDPQSTANDQSMISIEVNGLDIARKSWHFIRGYNYVPGFSQTHELAVNWYLAIGDTVRLVVAHNANQPSWLWWSPDYSGHNAQVCYMELDWMKP